MLDQDVPENRKKFGFRSRAFFVNHDDLLKSLEDELRAVLHFKEKLDRGVGLELEKFVNQMQQGFN